MDMQTYLKELDQEIKRKGELRNEILQLVKDRTPVNVIPDWDNYYSCQTKDSLSDNGVIEPIAHQLACMLDDKKKQLEDLAIVQHDNTISIIVKYK